MLRERLFQLIADRNAKRIDAVQQLKLFQELRQEVRGRQDLAHRLGLSEVGLAIYGLLAEPKPMVLSEPLAPRHSAPVDDAKKELASLLEEQLAPQVTLIDWIHKDDVQREMRRLIKRQLRAGGFSADKIDPTAESIVDLMKRKKGG